MQFGYHGLVFVTAQEMETPYVSGTRGQVRDARLLTNTLVWGG